MPHRQVPPRSRQFAKSMRQEMTPPEARLWRHLRKPGLPGLRFRRQAPIGRYIVDFLCPQHRLIVEVDGDSHGTNSSVRRDIDRDLWLQSQGYRVIRVWNHEILTNIDGVLQFITDAIKPPPEIR